MNNINKRRISYLVTIIILVTLFIVLKDYHWVGSTNTHTIMESIATTLAIMIGISALVRFHAKRDEVLFLWTRIERLSCDSKRVQSMSMDLRSALVASFR